MKHSTDMRYRVFAGDRLVGMSDLPHVDLSMGGACGPFVPTREYDPIQAVFRMKTDATSDIAGGTHDEEMLERYYDALARLDLRLENASGATLPTEWIDIDDFSVELGADDEDAFQLNAQFKDIKTLDAEHLEEAERADAERWSRASEE